MQEFFKSNTGPPLLLLEFLPIAPLTRCFTSRFSCAGDFFWKLRDSPPSIMSTLKLNSKVKREIDFMLVTYEEILLSRLKYQSIWKCAERLKDYTEVSQLHGVVAF